MQNVDNGPFVDEFYRLRSAGFPQNILRLPKNGAQIIHFNRIM